MIVNGEKLDLSNLSGITTLTLLIEHLKLAPQRVAVEFNGDIISRGAYATTTLSEGDIIEIIHYVGGG
jgi:sulfur carrier protein